MITLSLIVPSLLHQKHLKRLFDSLKQQVFPHPYEILLCATNVSPAIGEKIKKQNSQLPVSVLSTTQANISAARNLGIQKAKGQVLFFIDEDCALPSRDYLQRVYAFHLAYPKSAAGGYYLDPLLFKPNCDSTYNLFCNAWLESHKNPQGNAQVLLGGCSFYPARLLKEKNILFNEACARAGEEYSLNKAWTDGGHRMILSAEWSVYHTPEANLVDLLKKSWIQGQQISTNQMLPSKRQWQHVARYLSLHPQKSLKHFPLLALYGIVGRLSSLKTQTQKRLEKNPPEPQENKKYVSITSGKKLSIPAPKKKKIGSQKNKELNKKYLPKPSVDAHLLNSKQKKKNTETAIKF